MFSVFSLLLLLYLNSNTNVLNTDHYIRIITAAESLSGLEITQKKTELTSVQ